MILVEKHIIKKSHKYYKEIDELSFASKNLYNKSLYVVRQDFIKKGKYLNYYDIQKLAQTENWDEYRSLPAKVSQQTLKLLDKNWVSFFSAIKEWKKNPDKFLGRPKLPNYKKKESGRNILIYTNQALLKPKLKTGSFRLSKTNIEITTKQDNIQQCRIVPRYGHYVVEVVYKKEEVDQNVNKENFIGIDIGLNNLCAIVSNKKAPLIISGKPIKSINQFYNKKKAKLQSNLVNKNYTSNKIEKLTLKRSNKIKDYLHKTSRYVVDYCLTNDFGKIIIGKNDGWKQEINIGRRNNQSFVQIPFAVLIEMIQYKARLVGIDVVLTEEGYTSKCSFVDSEKMEHNKKYLGKRVKRGLFRSANNLKLNADVNGAYNIIRKVVPKFDFSNDGIEGLVFSPIKKLVF